MGTINYITVLLVLEYNKIFNSNHKWHENSLFYFKKDENAHRFALRRELLEIERDRKKYSDKKRDRDRKKDREKLQ